MDVGFSGLHRIGVAAVRFVDHGGDAVTVEPRAKAFDLARGEKTRVDANVALHRDVGLGARHHLLVQDEEVAIANVAATLADFLWQGREHADRRLAQAHKQGIGVMLAHDRGAFAGAASCRHLAVYQKDSPNPALLEMVGGAGAGDAGADNDDVVGGHDLFLWIVRAHVGL